MADTPPSMAAPVAEPLASMVKADRLAFRKALDLYFQSLRADWAVHEHRDNVDDVAKTQLGHNAAVAWSSFFEVLDDLVSSAEADPEIREAAALLIRLDPGHMPDKQDIMAARGELLRSFHKAKKSKSASSNLLFDAYALTEAHLANLALIEMQRAA